MSDACVIDALQARIAIHAANELLMDGYRVTSIQADQHRLRPVVWLAHEPRLTRKVEQQHACYCQLGHDTAGQFRVGHFLHLGASVKWIERPTPHTDPASWGF